MSIVQGDNGVPIPFIVAKPRALDITGATVEVAIKRGEDTFIKTAEILDAVKGKCQFTLAYTDLTIEGVYKYQWTVYFEDGRFFHGDPSDFYAKEKLVEVTGGGEAGETLIIPFVNR